MNSVQQHQEHCFQPSVAERLDMTLELMGEFGLRFPTTDEFKRLHQSFQPMIEAPITSNESVATVHAITGQCAFVISDDVGLAGSMLLIQLSGEGIQRLQSGETFGHDIDPAWVCPPKHIPAGLLVWGLLGKSKWYAGRVLSFSLALARGVYSDVPILTYAATPDGAQIMRRVGFSPTEVKGLYQLKLDASDER